MTHSSLTRRALWRAVFAVALAGLAGFAALPAGRAEAATGGNGFQLTSTDLKDGGRMPEAQAYNGFGRHGSNISPQLSWTGAPVGTKSFVITLYDPDAPTGSGWWHWVVVNIPASVHELARGAGSGLAKLPEGALETRTDFGHPGYGGAAPPAGETHRYIFTVYALKTDTLDVGADTSAAMIGFLVHDNLLAKATLTVRYGP